MSRRISFLCAGVRGGAFELVYRVGDREASVLVTRVGIRPTFTFPHVLGESGESLGSIAADAALIERAQQFIAARDGGSAWSRYREATS
jgi:hypothetical protein